MTRRWVLPFAAVSLAVVAEAGCVGDDPTIGLPAPSTPDAASPTDGAAADQTSSTDGGADGAGGPSYCDSLIAYWPGNGNAKDVKGANTLAWFPAASSARYASGHAFQVDYDGSASAGEAFELGSTTRLEAQTTSGFDNLTNVTVVGWANSLPTAMANPYGSIFCAGVSRIVPTGGFCIARAALSLEVYADTTMVSFSLAGGPPDPWAGAVYHFFAVTLAAKPNGMTGEVSLTWEGTPRSSRTAALPATLVTTPSPTVRIGGEAPSLGNNPFNGLIDDLAAFSRVLTPAEVESIRNAGLVCP